MCLRGAIGACRRLAGRDTRRIVGGIALVLGVDHMQADLRLAHHVDPDLGDISHQRILAEDDRFFVIGQAIAVRIRQRRRGREAVDLIAVEQQRIRLPVVLRSACVPIRIDAGRITLVHARLDPVVQPITVRIAAARI